MNVLKRGQRAMSSLRLTTTTIGCVLLAACTEVSGTPLPPVAPGETSERAQAGAVPSGGRVARGLPAPAEGTSAPAAPEAAASGPPAAVPVGVALDAAVARAAADVVKGRWTSDPLLRIGDDTAIVMLRDGDEQPHQAPRPQRVAVITPQKVVTHSFKYYCVGYQPFIPEGRGVIGPTFKRVRGDGSTWLIVECEQGTAVVDGYSVPNEYAVFERMSAAWAEVEQLSLPDVGSIGDENHDGIPDFATTIAGVQLDAKPYYMNGYAACRLVSSGHVQAGAPGRTQWDGMVFSAVNPTLRPWYVTALSEARAEPRSERGRAASEARTKGQTDLFGCSSHAFAIAVRVYVYSRMLGAKDADALKEADAIAKVHATAPGDCGSEVDGCVAASSVRPWARLRKNLTELQFPVFP